MADITSNPILASTNIQQANTIPTSTTSIAGTNTTTPVSATTIGATTGANAADVYSAANLTSALSTPYTRPDLSDPYGLRTNIQNQLGIGGVQSNVNALMENLNKFDVSTKKQQSYLGNQQVAMPVITGQQAYAGQQSALTRESLTGELTAAQSYLQALQSEADQRLQVAQNERSQITSMILQAPGAKIGYGDTVEQAAKKMQDFTEKTTKEASKTATQQAEVQLFANTLGYMPKGTKLTTKEKKLLKAAGVTDRQLKLAAAKASISTKSTDTLYSITTSMKNQGKSWGEIADTLGKKGYDLTPGSKDSQSLDAIMTGKAPVKQAAYLTKEEINKQISQISDWKSVSDEDKQAYIRSLGGNPSDFGY